jgi:hypothetical protein
VSFTKFHYKIRNAMYNLQLQYYMPLQNSYRGAAHERHFGTFVLKARTVDPEKQPLLGNGCVTLNNGVTVRCGVFCAVHAEAI